MPAVKVKIKSLPRFDLPRFTSAEMREIGEQVKDAEVARIKRAEMPDGSAAKPLSNLRRYRKKGGETILRNKGGYKDNKRRIKAKLGTASAFDPLNPKGNEVRDWTLTGAMLKSLSVVTRRTANGMSAVVKFTADQIKKAMIRENTDHMFALSVHGKTKGNEIAAKYLVRAVARANRAAKRAGQ